MHIAQTIAGAIDSAALVAEIRASERERAAREQGGRSTAPGVGGDHASKYASKYASNYASLRPAVMPYARALVGHDNGPFSRAMLASQIQLAAGMGAEGVVLWGASSDYKR
jgi:hypothetical protein